MAGRGTASQGMASQGMARLGEVTKQGGLMKDQKPTKKFVDESKAYYCRKNHVKRAVRVVVLFGRDDVIICQGVTEQGQEHYEGPYWRFLPSGKIESGVLWGGDVWDATDTVYDPAAA